MKIYVASSWRNKIQPLVVLALREAGHEVYDFRNPAPGNTGFQWSEIDPAWQSWTAELVVKVSRGVFVYNNTAIQANKITAAHVLKPCYMEDDQTVTALATGASVAGRVIRVDDEGVAVEIGSGITAPTGA